VEYLGYIVSHKCVKVGLNKNKAMREWTIPKTLKKIIGLLGLKCYNHRFVKNYGQIVAPLIELSNKEAFFLDSRNNQRF
jgi:hypothetical protein